MQQQLVQREAVLQVLDKAPDGYKFLARLSDDPCEVLRGYYSGSEKPSSNGLSRSEARFSKLEEHLKEWLIANLE